MFLRPRLLSLLLSFIALPAAAQDQPSAPPQGPEGPAEFDYAPTTIVLCNAKNEESVALAKHYMQQRAIPEENLIPLVCSDAETVTRDDYIGTIEDPLRTALVKKGFWKKVDNVPGQGKIAVETRVRVLAIMRGVPLRILNKQLDDKGAPAPNGIPQQNESSVDSELALVGAFDKDIKGPLRNPYHKANTAFARFPFTPMFITGRLDGPDFATAKRLIDDAIAVEKAGGLCGRVCIDLAKKGAGYEQGDDWLIEAARACETKGLPVIMDSWPETLPRNWPLLDCGLYYGWYTEHADGPFLNPSFRFRQGAVAVHIHSFSASTIRTAQQYWCGPLLAKGATCTLGNVWEPYLALCAHLDIFNDRLLAGYNFAEAASMAMPVLSWMSTALGDPLYRPFPQKQPETFPQADKDYRAIRLAMSRWGGSDEPALMSNLSKAAETLKSGNIYEFLALHAQAGEGNAAKKAAPYFEKALSAYKNPPDKIRIMLLTADALRRSGNNSNAAKMLEQIITAWPKLPETDAARELLKRWK